MNPYDKFDNNDNLENTGRNQDRAGSASQPEQPSSQGFGTGSFPYPTQSTQSAQTSQTSQTNQTAHTGQFTPPSGQSYGGYGQYPAYPQQNSYSWGPQGQSYYAQPSPSQPNPPQPKQKKKGGGRTFLKFAAGVLACAVVSLSSVGVFAAMIQNGVVDVESPEGAEQTAAFTLYKRADSGTDTTPTSTREGMSSQEIAQKLIPSVVCVQNYQVRQQQDGFYFGGFYFGGQDGQGDDSGELSPAGEGSGIIISEDGYIVTNQHVVDGATNISVVTSDGATYQAELVGEDTQTDLAVLKITTEDKLTPAEFGDSEDLQVTDQVLAIGNPGGLQFNSSVTIGYVSALNRPVTNSQTGFMVNCIQTDAAINPGNSGGALVDSNGLVVGINSSKIAATDYEGMGFAIPSNVAQPIVSDLIEYGYVKDRPMLGITGRYFDRTNASYFGFSQGYVVAEAVSDNAKASGLQPYDVITAIDDTQITSAGTIAAYIANKKPGDKVTLTVDRPLLGQTGVKIELALSENSGVSN